ncbi:hypothetical protein SLS56_009112 [Neofusicoccum ribis]|uniref:Uncharacterized protein n=1 Tax=Neofusicoccum ribis TaxID=45134 RepID=A0ABR3SI69_9PEZI
MATPTLDPIPTPTVHINMLEPLAPQLAPAPRTATTLSLTGETPTDAHFVLDLEDGEQRRREEEEWEEKQRTKVDEEDSNEDEESSTSEASVDDSEPESQSNQEGVDDGKEDADSTMEVSAPPAAATKPPKVSDETLAQAKKACERLDRVAESRGIKVEPFGGAWNKEFTGLDRKHLRVDARWEELSYSV